MFGVVRAAVLTGAIATSAAATSTATTVAGYTAAQAATYAWVSQGLIAPIHVFIWNDLAQRVRTGSIAVDLARPVDLQLGWLAADLGRAAYTLLPARSAPRADRRADHRAAASPRQALPYVLGALSIVLAVGISFACRFLVSLVAFWLTEIRGVLGTYSGVSVMLCGLLVPVPWFPPWLHAIAAATPFPSMLQTPLDVITARIDTAASLRAVAVQLIWLAVMLVAGRLALRAATRKLVVQGC